MRPFSTSKLPVELWLQVAQHLDSPRKAWESGYATDLSVAAVAGAALNPLEPDIPTQDQINLCSVDRYLRDVLSPYIRATIVIHVWEAEIYPGVVPAKDVEREVAASSAKTSQPPAGSEYTSLAIVMDQDSWMRTRTYQQAMDKIAAIIRHLPKLCSIVMRRDRRPYPLLAIEPQLVLALAEVPHLCTLVLRGLCLPTHATVPEKSFGSLRQVEAPLPLPASWLSTFPSLEEFRQNHHGHASQMKPRQMKLALLPQLQTLCLCEASFWDLADTLQTSFPVSPMALIALRAFVIEGAIDLVLLDILDTVSAPRLRLFVCRKLYGSGGRANRGVVVSRLGVKLALRAAFPLAKLVVYDGLMADGGAWTREPEQAV